MSDGGHTLTLHPGKSTDHCECGEKLPGANPVQRLKSWQSHVRTLTLLTQVAEAVRREREARAEGERLIIALIGEGVATARISEAIGYDGETLIMSPTTVQRIGRERSAEPDKPPRRRRRQ